MKNEAPPRGGALLLASALFFASGCTPAPAPIPHPNLDRMEKAAQDHLNKVYAGVEEALRRAASGPELGEVFRGAGLVYWRYDFKDAAKVCFQNAELLAPKNPKNPYYLAQLATVNGETEEAIAGFRRSLALDNAYVPALIHRGRVHVLRGELAAADADFERALRLDPKLAAAHEGTGQVALQRGDYPRAIEHLTRALELAPQSTALHNPLGTAYRESGDLERAREHLAITERRDVPLHDEWMQEMNRIDVGGWRQHQTRGTQLVVQEDLEAAAVEFKTGIDKAEEIGMRGETALLRANLAATLVLIGNERSKAGQRSEAAAYYFEAHRYFEEALALDPNAQRAHFSFGTLLAAQFGEDAKAVEHYTRSLELFPQQDEAHMNCANALRRLGRHDEALAHYAGVLTIYPTSEQARLGYARTLLKLKRYPEARSYLEESLRILPSSRDTRNTLMRLLATAPADAAADSTRVIREANAEFERAKSAGKPPDLAPYIWTSLALAQIGNFQKAVETLEFCLDQVRRLGKAEVAVELDGYLAKVKRGEKITEPWPAEHPILAPPPLRSSIPPELLEKFRRMRSAAATGS